jgi:hypothetical protein
MGMRRATIGSIVVLVLLAVLTFSMQQTVDKKVRAAIACQNEVVLIDYWKSVNLIREIHQDGNNLVATVSDGMWTEMPRKLQLQIGKAAYCPILHAGKGGVARIEDFDGKELARVENGQWSSKQFPE